MENRVVGCTLIKYNGKYLVTKRSKKENVYPEYWDIPGGIVDPGELPKDGAKRETKEEVNLDVIPTKIIHEDSNYDKKKDAVYIRLVYLCELISDFNEIELDPEEHSEYKLISSIDELKGEKVVPFVIDIFENELD